MKQSMLPSRSGRAPAAHPVQALSNTLWGLSKLEIKNEPLMLAIGEEARTRLHGFNSQNLANSVRNGRGPGAGWVGGRRGGCGRGWQQSRRMVWW